MRHIKSLGARINALREERGLTVADLERRTGLDNEVIRRLESGRTIDPRLSTLAKLAMALGVEIVDLLNGKSKKGT